MYVAGTSVTTTLSALGGSYALTGATAALKLGHTAGSSSYTLTAPAPWSPQHVRCGR
jgi:hypothetical protein